MFEPNRLSNKVFHAQSYKPVEDLWVVTSFFNSQNYATKYHNFSIFIKTLEDSSLKYLVIECAFNDQPFELPESPNIIKVRTKSVLWQKERLLNLAISHLPETCTKVAWVDCDVLFENESWALETSRLLDTQVIVQPFDMVIRLPKETTHFEGEGLIWESFASVYQNHDSQYPISDFTLHGHTGFAWAARRDFLSEHGLYDPCLSGSADHLMVHAFTGDFDSPCIKQTFGDNEFTSEHFNKWAQAVYPDVKGKIGSVPGTILHLWHGDTFNRQYLKREQEVAQLKFNPFIDVSFNKDGCWEWSGEGLAKKDLIEWAIDFYGSRKEDG